ncbi:MAG: OmpH family outer membrane protein [SAR324 cluster bacterium]|nr:OmpH family outer membrane protein [SAR324 cluster bacterium]
MPNRRMYIRTACAVALFLIVPAICTVFAAGADGPKIGIVNFQRVLNDSEAGKRSRKILLASKDQKESELKAIGENLKKEREELKNNILLTDAAKAKKQKELRARESRWRGDYKAAERDLQRKQIKVSESIFSEVQTVINLISKEENFDFVIEQALARSILFSRTKPINITSKVIERYNNISK